MVKWQNHFNKKFNLSIDCLTVSKILTKKEKWLDLPHHKRIWQRAEGRNNVEFTYAVCRICLDLTYSGMDVSEEIMANIMNSLEDEAVSLLLLSVILINWLILIFDGS